MGVLSFKQAIAEFWNDQRGVTSVEYAVLLCGLLIGAATIWMILTTSLETAAGNAGTSLDEARGL